MIIDMGFTHLFPFMPLVSTLRQFVSVLVDGFGSVPSAQSVAVLLTGLPHLSYSVQHALQSLRWSRRKSICQMRFRVA